MKKSVLACLGFASALMALPEAGFGTGRSENSEDPREEHR
jgi:hypothetical protein